jgi:maltooligosyltrehalose trehalohydrolase
MIFQGEEFAASNPFQYFADHEDPKMAKSVSEGRRREFAAFGWDPAQIPDPESPETFLRSKLNWNEIGAPRHAAMLDWYRKLIRLRRSSAALNHGDLRDTAVAFDEDKRWLTMERRAERKVVMVLCNLGDEAVQLPNEEQLPILLSTGVEIRSVGNQIHLPPDSVAILSDENIGL